jgi:prefoldin subunit 5
MEQVENIKNKIETINAMIHTVEKEIDAVEKEIKEFEHDVNVSTEAEDKKFRLRDGEIGRDLHRLYTIKCQLSQMGLEVSPEIDGKIVEYKSELKELTRRMFEIKTLNNNKQKCLLELRNVRKKINFTTNKVEECPICCDSEAHISTACCSLKQCLKCAIQMCKKGTCSQCRRNVRYDDLKHTVFTCAN